MSISAPRAGFRCDEPGATAVSSGKSHGPCHGGPPGKQEGWLPTRKAPAPWPGRPLPLSRAEIKERRNSGAYRALSISAELSRMSAKDKFPTQDLSLHQPTHAPHCPRGPPSSLTSPLAPSKRGPPTPSFSLIRRGGSLQIMSPNIRSPLDTKALSLDFMQRRFTTSHTSKCF